MSAVYLGTNVNRQILYDGSVHYSHPITPYQKAVNELGRYVPVYETQIPDNEHGNVIGQTQFDSNGKPVRVLIEAKDPGVVYHEMYHVIMRGGTEPDADKYATSKGFPIHDATYK
jgi:hypothetical protein